MEVADIINDPWEIMNNLGQYLKKRRGELQNGPDADFVQKYISYWQIRHIYDFEPPSRHHADNNHYDVVWEVDTSSEEAYATNSRFVFKWRVQCLPDH